MKSKYLSVLVAVLLPAALCAQNITGPWKGELKAGSQTLETIFTFNADGSVTFDVPAQSARGIPVKVNLLTADSVSLEVPSIAMTYNGKLRDGVIRGTFVQMGAAFPLDLVPGREERPERPQEPQEPFPYETCEVSFPGGAPGVMLAGTLTFPEGRRPEDRVPVVVMVTGSGSQNRDEEVFGHRPFLVIADYLARSGIASLRYDDRGTGESGGSSAGCTTEDFAADAAAAIDFLRQEGGFGKVGILGHSEGGMIAFMLGARRSADFIVSLAGPGIKGDTLLAEQQNAALSLHGIPPKVSVVALRAQLAMQPQGAWLQWFIDYDPAEDLEAIEIPVMAVNGGNDLQVIPDTNLEAIRKVLEGKNPANLIREYPGLNHLFQHCTRQSALDYYNNTETFSAQVLEDIAAWINSLER